MNTMCRNIIEKSVIGVLIYAGKRFVDKCFFDKNYGSRSKKGEIPRFELSHNALNRKPQK